MDLVDFKRSIAAKTAIIGFDFGIKRLGVAVSDLTRTIASSYTIIERKSKASDIEKGRRSCRGGEEICRICG